MYRITFVLNLFKGENDRELSHASLKTLLMALMHLDVLYLRAHPETPLLIGPDGTGPVKYAEEPPGQEDWQDIPTTLKLGWGDCLPTRTLVTLVTNKRQVPIWTLRVGDVIVGDEGMRTTVKAVALTGEKPILRFRLSNSRVLYCSPEHRLLLRNGAEIRAKDVVRGMELRSLPGVEPPCVLGRCEEPKEQCCDITTDTGRFYLPESDVVVHNCEDLACWRAAELRVRHNIMAEPTFIWKLRANGGYLYHILVKYPDGRIEDPSRTLGMR